MFYLMLEANIEETCNMIVVNNNNIPNKKLLKVLASYKEVQLELEMLQIDIFAKLEL